MSEPLSWRVMVAFVPQSLIMPLLMDALLLAAGAQLIVLERLPVPQTVAVGGKVGAVLSEVFVFAPGAHISLIGKRCCDANHCHQQYQEPLFCKVFLHISCMLFCRFSLSRKEEALDPISPFLQFLCKVTSFFYK